MTDDQLCNMIESADGMRCVDGEYRIDGRDLMNLARTLATRASEAAPELEVFDSHEVDHGTHVEIVPHYRSETMWGDQEKLPALARTAEGQRLYAMAYARGRKRERLNATGKPGSNANSAIEPESGQRELRVILPEGGHANLLWPDELTSESAQMLSDMFDTVMKSFARAAAGKISGAPDAAKGKSA